jgi:hypothetical protein
MQRTIMWRTQWTTSSDGGFCSAALNLVYVAVDGAAVYFVAFVTYFNGRS